MLMALVGCDKPNDEDKPSSVGNFDAIENEWKLVSVNGTPNEFNVYISFDQGTFAMYQQVYTLDYQFYDGEYKVEGGKLTGEYFEGGAWKCAYTGGVSEDGNTLTLKSDETNSITCVYEACTIPENIKEEALAGTRAVEVVPFL
jgi:hypothetical protein